MGQLPEAKKISKAEIARRLESGRIQVARFLDPENTAVCRSPQLRKLRSSEDVPGSQFVCSCGDSGITRRVRCHLGRSLSIEAYEPFLEWAATLGVKLVPDRAHK
jgi:hypothetical protein